MDLDAEHRPLVSLFVLTRFPDANRHPLRLKTLSYKFFVHVRHPSYRLVTRADVREDPYKAYQWPVFGIEDHGSFGASGLPFCKSSTDCLSGERTNAMLPSRGGRLMVTPPAISRAQVS